MDDILIVGAGPTGLMAAVWLAACGIKARIVDPKPGPTPETRAVTLQARTLELWSILGIADRALERGRKATGADAWIDGRVAFRVPLERLGRGQSPFPYVLLLAQSETEAILHDRLRELGGEVEWGTRVEGLEGNRVTIGGEKAEFRFVLGCDGASSAMRKAIGLDFAGGTYEGRFFVADLEAKGGIVPGEVNIAFLPDRFFAFFPLKAEHRYRIAGLLRGEEPTEADMRRDVEREMRTKVGDVRWFSLYRVHHRVVPTFRKGPVFLLGDAAHVHSPVGGQGMNAGLGDAINLAWKLAEVVGHGADERLLDSYDAERRPFARTLVATTDRAFEAVVNPRPLARLLRTRLMPLGLPLALRLPVVQRTAFRALSQTRIRYRRSPLAEGPRAGDRLPPYPGDGARPDRWRLLVPSEARGAGAWCAKRGVDLRTTTANAAFLVRPDGHIGLSAVAFDPATFDRYLRERVGRPL